MTRHAIIDECAAVADYHARVLQQCANEARTKDYALQCARAREEAERIAKKLRALKTSPDLPLAQVPEGMREKLLPIICGYDCRYTETAHRVVDDVLAILSASPAAQKGER